MSITIELADPLRRVAEQSERLRESARRALYDEFARLGSSLGVPVVHDVTIVTSANATSVDGHPVRVLVDDHECRYARLLTDRAAALTAGLRHGALVGADAHQWLRDRCEALDVAALVAFLRVLCTEIVKQRLSVLLGDAQLAAYAENLPKPRTAEPGELPPGITWPPSADLLRLVLTPVLDLGISVAAHKAVAGDIYAGIVGERSAADIAEAIIARARSREVVILANDDYRRDLMELGIAKSPDGVSKLRDGLFYELGMQYPAIRVEPDSTLGSTCFAVRVNDVVAMPRAGLQLGELLVNETPERLRVWHDVRSTAAINPANGNEVAIISAADEDVVRSAGLTTWDAYQYVVLCLGVELRERGACFINHDVAWWALDKLNEAFPALVDAVRNRYSDEQLARVLRALVAEQVPIRNLRRIFETVLDFDVIEASSAQYIIFDDRLPVEGGPSASSLSDTRNIAAQVRMGLRRELSHMYSRGSSTILVYLLDPAIERTLSAPVLDRADEARILAAVRHEVQPARSGEQRAVILTTVDVRERLRTLIAPELPETPVVAYQELAPDCNVQPLARITLANP